MGGLVVGALLACALGISLGVGVASAVNWDANDGSYKAGDSNVYFHQCKLSPNTHQAFHSNDQHDIEPTDIDTYLYHGCTNVDVRINDGPYGFGDKSYGYGRYECHAKYHPQGCDKGHVHINTSWYFIPENYSDTLSLMCQEIGHSVGLGHRRRENNTSCMSLVEQRYDLNACHLDSHDIWHLNDRYR